MCLRAHGALFLSTFSAQRQPGIEMDKVLLEKDDIQRALVRLAHEIIERNRGTEGLVLLGIPTRGVPLANRLAKFIKTTEGKSVPTGILDVVNHRDDRPGGQRPDQSRIPVPLEGAKVVLVDEVIYTGRTARAAMDAAVDYGRPACIQLAVLIDRGHRELPIRADYAGRNIPTSRKEWVFVHLEETDGKDEVIIREVQD